MKKHCSPDCLGWNKGIGTEECRECGNTPPNAKSEIMCCILCKNWAPDTEELCFEHCANACDRQMADECEATGKDESCYCQMFSRQPAKPDTEGPFMPELDKLANELTCMMGCDHIAAAIEREDAIRAILAELPDETTPTARYLKEIILPRLNRIRDILKS